MAPARRASWLVKENGAGRICCGCTAGADELRRGAGASCSFSIEAPETFPSAHPNRPEVDIAPGQFICRPRRTIDVRRLTIPKPLEAAKLRPYKPRLARRTAIRRSLRCVRLGSSDG